MLQVKRITAVALVIGAAAAPAASAGVTDPPGTGSVEQRRVEAPRGSSRFDEMVALDKASRNRALQQAENAPVRAIVRPQGGGFDWTSAAIGATVPLALLLLDLVARPAVSRRRNRLARVAS